MESMEYLFEHAYIFIYDIKSGQQQLEFTEGLVVLSLAFSPNGQYLASGSLDRAIRIWDLANNKF